MHILQNNKIMVVYNISGNICGVACQLTNDINDVTVGTPTNLNGIDDKGQFKSISVGNIVFIAYVVSTSDNSLFCLECTIKSGTTITIRNSCFR